ncbi:hypothetical protein HYV89_04070 [Candidatus Woesearchaeota archaeon]|nr:hypothetical protein [Candidatus Woesearchaeota archaeon]
MKTLKLKDERVSLNPKDHRRFEHKFIEVRIFKGDKSISFIKYITQSRFYIPKNLREKISLNRGDTINIEIEEIKNKRRERQIIKNDKFNILSLIPEKTRSGYPILVLEEKTNGNVGI